MRRSKIRAYVHLVWGTYQRLPLITPEMEPRLYRCIHALAQRAGAEVIALGGMPDHLHLLVAFPSSISFGDFMRQIKSVSSKFVSEELLPDGFFKWQDGYGLFTLGMNQIDVIKTYVLNQKHHHASGKIFPQ